MRSFQLNDNVEWNSADGQHVGIVENVLKESDGNFVMIRGQGKDAERWFKLPMDKPSLRKIHGE